MNIAVISASTRINRQSHRVALGLAQFIENRRHTAGILDLAAYNFPIMEEVYHRHPNPPEGLADFSQKIKDADAFIFVSPEYNGTYTSALKNAVDYLKENEFNKKVIGIVSVSAGGLGGIRAALSMQQLVLGVGGFAIPQMLPVGNVAARFDEEGQLTDPVFERSINVFLDAFLWLAEAVAEKKAIISV